MRQAMSKEQADQLRLQAIERAKELDIVGAVKYLLENDPLRNNMDKTHKTRPLPGTGLMLHGRFGSNLSYSLSVANAYNETERLFLFEKSVGNERFRVFKDGSWVQVLLGAVEAQRFEIDNADVLEIVRNFAPESGTFGESDNAVSTQTGR